MRLLNCTVSIVILLVMCACGPATEQASLHAGPADKASRPDSATQAQLNASLPSLAALRGTSAITDNIIAADAQLKASPGFAIEGDPGFELARLNAADGGPFEWAVYGFAPPAGPLLQVELILVDQQAIDPVYIALSDYSAGHWVFEKFSAAEASLSVVLPLDSAVHLSSGLPPTAYIAVIAPVGSDLSLQGIVVRTIENDPPQAELLADIQTGSVPLTVNFQAAGSFDPDGSIVHYEFDFEDDGTYDISGTESSTQCIYINPGAYTARLRVTDDGGASATASLQINADPPPNEFPAAVLLVTPDEVEVGETVTLDGSQSSDPDGSIVKYEWDTDGNGSFELDSGTVPSVDFSATEAGPFVLQLRVTDDDGAVATTPAPLSVHGWNSTVLDSPGETGEVSSLLVVNGYPAICYSDYNSGDLRYVRANDPYGVLWGAPISVESEGDVGYACSMAIVNGNPAISYLDAANGDLRYVRAIDAEGASWGTPLAAVSAGNVGDYTSLAVINGKPAISYYDSGNSDLCYVQATDADGTGWATPLTLDSSGSTGYYTSLEPVNGNPAISYYDSSNSDLRFIRASDADGTAWGLPLTLDSAGNTGSFTSLAIINGFPAIAYSDTTNYDLRYIRASDANGTSWNTPLSPETLGSTGYSPALATIGGVPAICFFDITNEEMRFIKASDADGATWGLSELVDSGAGSGQTNSLVALNDGSPGMSYYDSVNKDLRYAFGF